MTRTIDCRNLDCRKPAITTKICHERIPEAERSAIILDSRPRKANISRFLQTQMIYVSHAGNSN
ncbi:sulfurtransferase TusA family protein, partial [Campylobacter concisus]|uniref:sulfurtransferase TusA family protein n=1 Tax=Campylobacter concisus TaxID=199 RepID=UPI001CA534FE